MKVGDLVRVRPAAGKRLTRVIVGELGVIISIYNGISASPPSCKVKLFRNFNNMDAWTLLHLEDELEVISEGR